MRGCDRLEPVTHVRFRDGREDAGEDPSVVVPRNSRATGASVRSEAVRNPSRPDGLREGAGIRVVREDNRRLNMTSSVTITAR